MEFENGTPELTEASAVESVGSLFDLNADKLSQNVALRYRDVSTSEWVSVTWQEYKSRVRRLSSALLH
ncbi:MAG: hypothetical protein C0403_10835, partial [Desulfobacterium sp.]|nr:hypothetical protein [Desulfobacterium sp.]